MGKNQKNSKQHNLLIGITVLIFAACTLFGYAVAKNDRDGELTDIELLGKYIFFDNISNPQRMSCSTCHEPRTGGTSAISGINIHDVVMPGADPHTFGTRKPPSNMYRASVHHFFTILTALGLQAQEVVISGMAVPSVGEVKYSLEMEASRLFARRFFFPDMTTVCILVPPPIRI